MHRTDSSTVGGRGIPALPSRSGRLPMLVVVVVLLATALVWLAVPSALALPALSLLMLSTGFALAAGIRWAGLRTEPDRAGAGDVAGALVFLGFVAALLSDAEPVLALLDRLQAGVVAPGPM